MAGAFEELANLDRLVHEPARLAILTALTAVENADFLFLQRLTGLTGGNLSTHLSRLSEAGLVYIEKQFIDRRPNTQVQITPQGRDAVNAHWKKLEELRKTSQNWQAGHTR